MTKRFQIKEVKEVKYSDTLEALFDFIVSAAKIRINLANMKP